MKRTSKTRRKVPKRAQNFPSSELHWFPSLGARAEAVPSKLPEMLLEQILQEPLGPVTWPSATSVFPKKDCHVGASQGSQRRRRNFRQHGLLHLKHGSEVLDPTLSFKEDSGARSSSFERSLQVPLLLHPTSQIPKPGPDSHCTACRRIAEPTPQNFDSFPLQGPGLKSQELPVPVPATRRRQQKTAKARAAGEQARLPLGDARQQVRQMLSQ